MTEKHRDGYGSFLKISLVLNIIITMLMWRWTVSDFIVAHYSDAALPAVFFLYGVFMINKRWNQIAEQKEAK